MGGDAENPTDLSDITGAMYTYLVNGLAPVSNWTGLFRPGERVLLHFINAAAATYFDIRIPGLPMRLVQASGQFVQPVEIDEFRIEIAQTFDVIVEPQEDRAYTVFAESMDRSGYARGTLATREGMTAEVPARRPRPVLTMADMGMDHGAMPGMAMKPAAADTAATPPGHEGHDMSARPAGRWAPRRSTRWPAPCALRACGLPARCPQRSSTSATRTAPGNAAVPIMVGSRMTEPGLGLGEDGWRALRYVDLRALRPRTDFRAPDREIEMHLTGNMDRFMWSMDGVPFMAFPSRRANRSPLPSASASASRWSTTR